jgi:hypothetical protein
MCKKRLSQFLVNCVGGSIDQTTSTPQTSHDHPTNNDETPSEILSGWSSCETAHTSVKLLAFLRYQSQLKVHQMERASADFFSVSTQGRRIVVGVGFSVVFTILDWNHTTSTQTHSHPWSHVHIVRTTAPKVKISSILWIFCWIEKLLAIAMCVYAFGMQGGNGIVLAGGRWYSITRDN